MARGTIGTAEICHTSSAANQEAQTTHNPLILVMKVGDPMQPVPSPCCGKPLVDALLVTAVCSNCYEVVSLRGLAGPLASSPDGVVMRAAT